jgi:hypothetical protein
VDRLGEIWFSLEDLAEGDELRTWQEGSLPDALAVRSRWERRFWWLLEQDHAYPLAMRCE